LIRYALICDKGHDFEGWFSESGDFDRQKASGFSAVPPAVRSKSRRC